jgi:Polyketide cyclase / dehydrase and lipid transport
LKRCPCASRPDVLLYRAAVRVNASPERTWKLLSDWDRSAQWILGTTVEVVGAQREGVGARTRATTKIAGITLIDEMTVTRWEPPRLIQVEHHRKPVLGDAWFEIVPIDAGVQVEWVEDLELPFGRLGELGGSMVRAPVEWGLRTSLKRLRALIERAG